MRPEQNFRARRGAMEPAILSALNEKPMHGYEIITTIELESHGLWRPSAGSIYPTLTLMEEKGLLASREVDGKKIYSLTEDGQKELTQTNPWHDRDFRKSLRAAHSAHLAVRSHFRNNDLRKTMMTMRQIFHSGDEAKREALINALKEFNDKIELINKGQAK